MGRYRSFLGIWPTNATARWIALSNSSPVVWCLKKQPLAPFLWANSHSPRYGTCVSIMTATCGLLACGTNVIKTSKPKRSGKAISNTTQSIRRDR